MSDVEILQLAAKAIGGVYDQLTECITFDGGLNYEQWEPLSNLSHALNLRHRLHLKTGFDGRFFGLCAYATYPTGPDSCNSIMQNVEEAGGKRAALRRAIVCAAAEMGKAKS
ncbi:hypothetical protein [Pseudomonas sp. zfem002]|uniref:hypothetical protein n=1 Tax=Pseudomonas sp. zfem002 TaxID=3078197 RepID=UPI002927AF94|nr:hypothetical protein [Pseudomonas sp. zfem002]MDU9391895.1 hypothetical protein [Pseudomonas sp. zfem002]